MDTESPAPLSSPSPPSSQESSATINREILEPEEYETASEPEMDDSDAVPVLEKTMASFPASEHGDAVDESFDKEVLGENSQEKTEEENLDSWQHNQLGSIGSVSDDVLDGVQNGAGEIPVEVNENVGGEMENSNNFNTGISQELESDESGKDDSNDSAMEPKAIETGGNRVTDSFSYSSINQSDFEEVEPKGSEVEFSVALTEEVKPDTERRITSNEEETEETEEKEEKEDEEKTLKTDDSLLADDHVLEHRNVDLEEPTFVEAETKEIFVDASERADAGDESEAGQKSAKQEEAGVMNEAKSEASVTSSILLNAETPEFNLFCSSNDEASERGEGLVECPALMESKPVKIAVNKFDQVNGIEVSDTEALSDSEDVSSCGVSELLTTEGDPLKSTIEEEIHPISANETVIGEENTIGTTTESHRSIDDKLDQSIASEVNEKISSLNQEFTDEKVVVGSGHASSLSEIDLAHKSNANDDDMKTNAATLSDNARENVVGDSETSSECLPQASVLDQKVEPDDDDDDCHVVATEVEKNQGNENEVNRISDGPSMVSILDSPEVAKQIIKEMERINSNSQSNIQATRDYLRNADGQIVSDSDDVLDSDEEGEAGELFDSAALAALLKAATGSSDGTVTVTAQDAARIFSVDRPAGLGTAPSLRPAAPRSTRPSLFSPAELTAAVSEPSTSMSDDEKKLHEKVEQIMVKFLRLVYRLGHSPEDAVAAQVLYRLNLAEGIRQGRQVSRSFNIENAKKQALQLEEGKNDLEFSCNILVFGKTGVGKSATINSIFGEKKSSTNPFQPTTTSVREISGVIDGVKIRVIDTPGLKSSIMDQATNRKILLSIKKFTKNCPPDIVLYVDRMDTQTHDFNDLPLLRSITSILGSSIWFNAIVAFTHAASAPPDGPSGAPLTYDVFVAQRSHVVQQTIRQAAGDMRLLNPVALVENHPSCRRNREGERVLPNGVSWRTQLLLLSFSSKILSEANSLLKLQDSSPGKLFGFRLRPPPLPFLLSSILQSRAHPKLSGDQGGDAADSDVELDDFSDTERDEDDDEYDQLPPFKPLKKAQIANLTKEQRKAYFDEYDYRAKLLQKKQWKEELRRLKEIKKNGKGSMNDNFTGDMPEDYDQDGVPAAVQVPLPDMVLPPSFDCDNPAYRYRFLEPTSQLLTRPVLDTHGWDHDCGYDGVSIEESLAIAGHFPTSMAVQITKDKKEFNIHLDSSIAAKHGEHGSTLAGFDIQTVGKQLAYVLRGETKVKNLKRNKTAAGVSITFLGGTVATGLKVEDRILISKRLGLVASTGAVRAQGDVAFGANLEARLRDKDYPLGQALSTLGLSLMKWRNDLALGANLQSQFSVGRNSKMAIRAGLNNKLTGQITVRTSTTEQFQIALAGIVPLAIFIYRSIRPNESYFDH